MTNYTEAHHAPAMRAVYGTAVNSIHGQEAARHVRSILREAGQEPCHAPSWQRMTESCRITLAERLLDPIEDAQRRKLLHAQRILARCESIDESVDIDDFDTIAEVLSGTRLPFGIQQRLVNEWLEDGITVAPHLKDVAEWAATDPKRVPKQGGWDAILRVRLADMAWSATMAYPQYGKVLIEPLLNGRRLLEEGSTLCHCLREPGHAYRYALDCVAGRGEILHLSLVGNPIQCASMALRRTRGHEPQWVIRDLEAVNKGRPHALIQEAAKKGVRDRLNSYFNYAPAADEDDEDDTLLEE